MSKDQKSPENEIASKMPPGRNSLGKGFAMIELISRIILAVVVRFWRLCTTGLLFIVLVFCIQGGVLAFILLVFGILGKKTISSSLYKSVSENIPISIQSKTVNIFIPSPVPATFTSGTKI